MRPLEVDNQLKFLIGAGLYPSEEEIIQDALNCLLQIHPDYKLKIAVYRYQTEEMTLGKAAEIAEVSMETMKRFLMKNEVKPRLGQTIEEAQKDYLTLRRYLDERDCK
jgi:predicted HTH domain antitoxin